MPSTPSLLNDRDLADHVVELVQDASPEALRSLLRTLHPADIAGVLEGLPKGQRLRVAAELEPAALGAVMMETSASVRQQLIGATKAQRLAEAIHDLDLDALADLYDRLPPQVMQAVVRDMNAQRRERLEQLRQYPQDSAGGMMDADAIVIRDDMRLSVVRRYLRMMRRKQQNVMPATTDSLMVIDAAGRFQGVLSLVDLVSLGGDKLVREVMDTSVEGVPVTMPATKVARRFRDRNWVSAPVLDDQGQLLGRITIDDMVDVLEEEAEHSALAAAGLDQESDLFEPVGRSVRSRAIWLGVNLFNALISAWIIGRFGGAIEAMVALAVLMPVVASMGGVAGNQTLTLVTRGLATEQVSRRNTGALMRRELAVATLNGLFWAMIVGAVALVWFDKPALAAVFAIAVFINLVNGTLSGAMIPLLLQRLGLDPALAGGVVLTMLTDGIGFGVFLALATLFML